MNWYTLFFLIPNCISWKRQGVAFKAENTRDAVEKATEIAGRLSARMFAVAFHMELEDGVLYIDQPNVVFSYRYDNGKR